MRLLDLYSGAGGAARGYELAGFDTIVGIDIEPQKNYPYEFILGDVLDSYWGKFDLIHASPPCQLYSKTKNIGNSNSLDLIGATREKLIEGQIPYVIENVPGSPLKDPILLCGNSFGLKTYRHRLFECSFDIDQPPHKEHIHLTAKLGRPPKENEFIHVAGNFSGAEFARQAMGIDWMNRSEIGQAVPPAYTYYVGCQFMIYFENEKNKSMRSLRQRA